VAWTRRLAVLVVAVAAAAGAVAWALGPAFWRLTRGGGEVRAPSLDELVLRRQERGLGELIETLGKGPLLPREGGYALVLVRQRMLQSLLDGLVPSEYVVADRYTVRVTSARITLEDGLAFVKMEGRASLRGQEDDVYADLTVAGNLEVLRRAPAAEALPAHINVMAVEAHRVDVVVRNIRSAERLVEDLGRLKLEEWAALAASLQIPVRQQYAFEVPALDGAVRIAAARIPVSLEVRDVLAFHSGLWVTVAVSTSTGRTESLPLAAPGAAPSEAQAAAAASAAELATMRQRHARRHQQLEAVLAKDPIVAAAGRVSDDIVLVLRSDAARELLDAVADRYLSHVAIELPHLEVHERKQMDKDTFLGRIDLGTWTADFDIDGIEGELEAGRPTIRFEEGNSVAIELPVRVVGGRATGSLHFTWSAKGLANVVCRDFEVREALAGRAIPEVQQLEGRFALDASPRMLTARPEFDRTVLVRFDLLPESWAALRRRLAEEDRFTRCGMALHPDQLLERLRQLAERGVRVRLPSRLFRTITLPAQVAQTVTVADRPLVLDVAQSTLRTSPELVWYGASVRLEPSSVRDSR
jgi:hypothetical protein